MARGIRGITVRLHTKVPTNQKDEFNRTVFNIAAVDVENVLVGEPSTDDITTTTSLYGRKAQYVLAIPKDDSHDWENVEVEFWGKRWRTFGIPIQGIEELMPLEWNKKVWVERYE